MLLSYRFFPSINSRILATTDGSKRLKNETHDVGERAHAERRHRRGAIFCWYQGPSGTFRNGPSLRRVEARKRIPASGTPIADDASVRPVSRCSAQGSIKTA
jgi:hypothetical protein